MKALFSTVILWAGIFMTIAQGQDIFNKRLDLYTRNLNVFHQNELVAIISGTGMHEIKASDQWRRLLNSFKENLESVKDDIPEYLIYKIEYQKDYNLIVEEVEGIIRYKVTDGQSNFDSNQSKAILKDRNCTIQLNFGNLNDLLSRDYETMIESAFANLGKKPGKFESVYFPKSNYNYSFSKKQMLTKEEKTDLKFLIPVNATVGIFRGSPIYEFSFGLGLSFKKPSEERSNLLYAFYSSAFQYDKELEKTEVNYLAGLAWKYKRAGTISVAFPMEKDGIYEDFDIRLGATVHTRNNLAVSMYWNMAFDDSTNPSIPSLAFGFTF